MTDAGRLWRRIHEVAEIGRSEGGGVTRLSFTGEERAAKDLVASYMEEAGLAVREDAVGNLIGRREGSEPGAPVVLSGSHIDSVPSGGKFDGPLGVLAAIEAAQVLDEARATTRRPLEVVAFTDEEGARFSFGMIGSRALAGVLSPEDLGHADKNGVTVAEAMSRLGFDPQEIGAAARPPGSIAAYVELHIEQGRVLEGAGLPVGVVTGIAGPVWIRLSFEGEAGHAGTTPMGPQRHDALAAASAMMRLIEEEATATGSTVGTVGQLDLSPGGINIIPGRVSLSLDLRDIDEAVRDRVESRILERSREVCAGRGVRFESEPLQRLAPAPCSEETRAAASEACAELGYDPFELPSGAGHDGMQLAGVCPIGMIFVRSKDGISHNPAEWSSKEDCAAGAEVLRRTIVALANRQDRAG